MADPKLQQVILDALHKLRNGESAGGEGRAAVEGASAEAGLTASLNELSRQVTGLSASSRSQIDSLIANTQAVAQNTAAQSGGVREKIGSVGGALAGVLGSGLGLAPLVRKLAGLFEGSPPAPPTLVRYAAPPPFAIEAAIRKEAAPAPVTNDEAGPPRVEPAPASNGPHITIQVQAMDSRSFLDHSEDIARAVREAMLNMHAVNDTINDL